MRSALRRRLGDKYAMRKHQEEERNVRKEANRLEEDELAVAKVFA
jgi:ribosome biogenesis protein BRX1